MLSFTNRNTKTPYNEEVRGSINDCEGTDDAPARYSDEGGKGGGGDTVFHEIFSLKRIFGVDSFYVDVDEFGRSSSGKNGMEETPLVGLSAHDVSSSLLNTNQQSNAKTTFFNDGVSKVDFVLEFVERAVVAGAGQYEDGGDVERARELLRAKRELFCENLEKKGLKLEPRISEVNNSNSHSSDYGTFITDGNQKIVFIKVHAPFKVLVRAAVEAKLKFPVEKSNIKTKTNPFSSLDPFKIKDACIDDDSVERYIMDAIDDVDNLQKFLHFKNNNNDDESDFFTESERNKLVFSIMTWTKFGDNDFDIGPKNLECQGVFADVYPLHDGPISDNIEKHQPANDRQRLQSDWANPKRLFKYQPINAVRRYFGEKIALYFAWLGFYTSFLVFASMVGLLCFIYGLVISNESFDVIVKEVCDSDDRNATQRFLMCPVCDRDCDYYPLYTQCTYTKISRMFDNSATIFFAVFMSVWATVFLEFWKRKQASLAYDWHTIGFEEEDETARPEFNIRMKDNTRRNPVTGKMEHYMPKKQQRMRFIAANSVVVFFCFVVIATIVSIIVFRAVFMVVLSSSQNMTIHKNAKVVVSGVAATLNLIAINVLKVIYTRIAEKITDWENPRTETEYGDSLTSKMFWFQFVNTYGSIFYVAFFKANNIPGRARSFGKKYKEQGCSSQGCFVELTIQLVIIMIGQQIIGNITEILIPFIKIKYKKWKLGDRKLDSGNHTTHNTPQWILDHQCQNCEKNALFFEYLEIVLQYGFVTMFVAAFPLAPVFALINNLVEIRLDAVNFLHYSRRPTPQRAEDIGAWYGILATLTMFSTLVNAFVIAFTSEWVPRLVYKYRFSADRTLKGFTEFKLSYFNIKDFTEDQRPEHSTISQSYCRYPGYYERKAPYQRTHEYWTILAARLAFVIAFQALVQSISWLMAHIIPDVPEEVELAMKREKFLAKQHEK